MKLIYGTEGPLFVILFILSVLIWAAVIVGTLGAMLVVLLILYVFYLFAHSANISYIRGTGVRLSKEQYPDLYAQVEDACKKLGLAEVPDAYLLNSNGVLNALATRFLWRNFLVLYADIVNALDDRPGAVSFYIGHEIGHIRRGHLAWGPMLAPGKCFPFIGFAYRRAQEYTCDLHGLACCAELEDAQRALVVLAAG
jgi:Zn-dependent protease with chaperone function